MPAKGTGHIVAQTELANIFGVTTATVRSWESRGCPVVERGSRGKPSSYNTADVARWREAQAILGASGTSSALEYEEARRRRMIAMAILAEIDADLRRGTVADVDDMVDTVSAEYTRVRNKLLGIPPKIAPRLAAIKDPNVIHALIEAEIILALNELTADVRPPQLK